MFAVVGVFVSACQLVEHRSESLCAPDGERSHRFMVLQPLVVQNVFVKVGEWCSSITVFVETFAVPVVQSEPDISGAIASEGLY